MKSKNFEKVLPNGYKEVLHIDATKSKTGLIMNLLSFVILAVVLVVAIIPFFISDEGFSIGKFYEPDPAVRIPTMYIFCAVMLVYVVLHELVHGIVYKAMTGEKLTFGLKWSCAFCGVPNIYTYRKTAIFSCAAPLAVFTLIFGALTVFMYFVSPFYYILSAFMLGMHIGGCSGDIYIIYLLIKQKNPLVLMRDTGPEQFIYAPDDKSDTED